MLRAVASGHRIRTRRTTGRRRTTRCSATGARCFRWSGAATSVLSAATTTSAKSPRPLHSPHAML
eukprot:2439967-Rhodomonas_salina.3